MRLPRVFTQQTLAGQQQLLLEEAPSHHLSKVLRMAPGRELELFDGRGGSYRARILEQHKKQLRLCIEAFDPRERESPLDLELGIGISRGDRMDWVVQKATELGVTRISPLFTERTEVKLRGERLAKKQARWQQLAISACAQCQRNRLPQISAPLALDDWLARNQSQWRLVLHPREAKSLPQQASVESVSLLIGPEGGLSDAEITSAQSYQFRPLALGPRVLRTETAPVAAISLVQYLWGDF